MADRVKLIWDFRGPNAEPIATHHAQHLDEYAQSENLVNTITGQEKITAMHHIAFLVVEKKMMDTLREILKPTRGQIYDGP